MALSDEAIKKFAGLRVATDDRHPGREQVRRLVEGRSADARYDAYREKIYSFACLPKGWNTYSAEAPGARAIELAHDFIDLVEKHCLKVEWLAPSVDDSVMMTIATPLEKQEWEFFGDGDTVVMYRSANGEKSYVDLGEPEFESFLTRGNHAR